MNIPWSNVVIYTQIGSIGFICEQGKLVQLFFTDEHSSLRDPCDDMSKSIALQLDEYARGKRREFSVPINEKGTATQRLIWAALRAIPYGQQRTYGEIAEALGTSARVVGNACRCNPLALITPCHRIVGKASLGGFMGKRSGAELELKKRLLYHEISSQSSS